MLWTADTADKPKFRRVKTMQEELKAIQEEALAKVEEASDLKELQAIKVSFLGKKAR